MAHQRAAKPAVLAKILQSEPSTGFLVFTRTKHGADKVVRGLAKAGIVSHAIHGNKVQNQRERVLAAFRKGTCVRWSRPTSPRVASDVDGISHVVNFGSAERAEPTCIASVGTARAGAGGIAISLCDREEVVPA